jgi:1-acyl-sn-glycerol-3-phosphate acyltransferase
MLKLARTLFGPEGREIEEIQPSPESLALVGEQYRRLVPLAALGMRRLSRFTASGVDNIPREGPCILLMNHVALYDALHVSYAAERPVIFLASQALFKDDLRGRFLQSMGMISKRKFTPDTRAIRTLRGWVDAGAAVGIFPEGERSWDGQPLPMVPGIGKLVRFLQAPVVTARIHNGDHHWPRWAVNHRRGRVHVEFDAPVRFGRRDDVGGIEQHIREHIFPGAATKRWPVRGKALAEGLPNLLFRCPACDAAEALLTRGDEVRCSACSSAWTVDTASNLRAARGRAVDTSVAAQVALLMARVEGGLVQQESRFKADGEVLRSGPGRLLDQSGKKVEDLGPGRLILTRDTLRFDGPGGFTLPLTELRAATIEERRRLWLLTSDRILEPDLPFDSIVKWGWIIERWRKAAQTD